MVNFHFAYLLNKTRLKLLNKTFPYLFGNIRSLYFAFSDSFCLHLYLFAGPWRRFQLYTRISFTARVNLFNEMVPLPW